MTTLASFTTRALALAGLAALVAVPAATPARAASSSKIAQFYKGKQVSIVIGFSPGGGFDAYGRLAARYMGRYIPGHPQMIARNLPGASGLKAMEGLKAEPQDGTYMAIFNPGLVLRSITYPKKVKEDFRKYAFIGSITAADTVCYMWHTHGVKTWKQLTEQKKIAFGATSPSSSAYMDAAILRNVFGLPMKIVTGYPGSAQEKIAIERGELDGDCGSYSSINPEWIRDNKVYVTHRYARAPIPGVKAPYIVNLAPTQEKKTVLKLLLAINDFFRPVAASAKVPKARIIALRVALWHAVHNKDFLAQAKKEHRPINNPERGTEVQKEVAAMYRTPPALVEKARAAIK